MHKRWPHVYDQSVICECVVYALRWRPIWGGAPRFHFPYLRPHLRSSFIPCNPEC